MSSRLRNGTGSRISFFAFQDIIASVTGVLILVTLILASHLDKLASVDTKEAPEVLEQRLATLNELQTQLELESQALARSLALVQSQPDSSKIQTDIARLNSRIDEERSRLEVAKAQSQNLVRISHQRDTTLGLSGMREDVDKTRAEALAINRKDRSAHLAKEKLEAEVSKAESSLLKLKSQQGNLWLIPDEKLGSKEPILAVVSGDGVTLERFDKPDSHRTLKAAGSYSEFKRFLSEHSPGKQYFVFYVRPSGISLFNQLSEQAKDNSFEIGFDALEEKTRIHFTKPPSLDEPGTSEKSTQEGTPSVSAPQDGANSVTAVPSVQAPESSPPKANAPTAPRTATVPATNLGWWQRLLKAIGLD